MSTLLRRAFVTLRRLDFIYVTSTKFLYIPQEIFLFRNLEQLSLSLQHFLAKPLTDFEGLSNLKEIIVVISKEDDAVLKQASDADFQAFLTKKPNVEFSFIVHDFRLLQTHVPMGVPIKGLEVITCPVAKVTDTGTGRYVLSPKMIRTNVLPKLRRVKHLCFTIVPPNRARGFRDFMEHLYIQANIPKTGTGLLPKLETFQLGCSSPGDFYTTMADYIRRFGRNYENFREWVLFFDSFTFIRGPHSVLSHNARKNLDASREDASRCTGPPASAPHQARCSTSDRGLLSRKLYEILGRTEENFKLRIMTKNGYLGWSNVWPNVGPRRQDPELTRFMRQY